MSAEDSDPADEKVREQLEERAEELDDRIVDLLAWVLDTETRARIYVYLRENPNSTSEEIADGTGLYPSTVREALAELTADEKVDRHKREAAGAGNNPYEYEAIAPSTLVSDVVDEVQGELNTVFNLDAFLGGEQTESESSRGPISIEVSIEDESGDD